MGQKELMEKIALLETVNDQLLAELGHIDALMRQIGFNDGLTTVKATANEIREQGWALEDNLDDFEEMVDE